MIWIYTNACMYYMFIIYIIYMYVCMLNCSVMSDSLQIHGLQPARLLCPWDFTSKNTEVGCHFLLQHIINTMYYEYLWIYTNTIYTIILFTDGSQIPATLTLSYQPAGVGTSTLLPADRLRIGGRQGRIHVFGLEHMVWVFPGLGRQRRSMFFLGGGHEFGLRHL